MQPVAPRLSDRRRRRWYMGKKAMLATAMLAIAGGFVMADRCGVFGSWLSVAAPDMDKYNGKTFRVIHVVDGDTLDVDIPDGRHRTTRIRFWGIDTPETVKPNTPVQHFGKEASDFTKKMAIGQTVRLELNENKDTRDKYGRLLAYIYLPDGTMLNRLLVQEGYAYADPRFPHKYMREFLKLENQARQAKRGLWRDFKESDLPDYKLKREKAAADGASLAQPARNLQQNQAA